MNCLGTNNYSCDFNTGLKSQRTFTESGGGGGGISKEKIGYLMSVRYSHCIHTVIYCHSVSISDATTVYIQVKQSIRASPYSQVQTTTN